MSPDVQAPRAKSHMSINVADLGAALKFYRVLFGVEPVKCHDDYAKFELEDPPAVFSLQPGPRPAGASLSHIGLRFKNHDDVLAVQARLRAAGIPYTRQEGVICGYAKQSKCWAVDPDQNDWEIYVLESDVDPDSVRACLSQLVLDEPGTEAGACRLGPGDPFPERLPYDNGCVDELELDQTVNQVPMADAETMWAEAHRVIRPGGLLRVRGFVADRPISEVTTSAPRWVRRLPVLPTLGDIVSGARQAGFVSLQITRLNDAPVWRSDDVELFEFELHGHALAVGNAAAEREVLYKGPFRSVADEDGQNYPRGQRVRISERTWNQLRRGPVADHFLFLVAGAAATCGGDQRDICH